MRKLTKSLSIIALAVITLLSFAMVLGTIGIKADSATEQLLASTEFAIEDGAEVRMNVTADGDDVVISDYTENGIRFTAKIEKTAYETAKENGVVFGLIFARASDVKVAPLTEAIMFGEDAYYEVGKNVAYFESKDLIVDGDYAYLSISMVNFKEINRDVEFMAVPYVKAIDENGFAAYDVKEYDVAKAYSMAYVAQVAAEKDGLAEVVKNALLGNYVDGLTQNVEVAYAVGYGEDKVEKTATIALGVGDTITVDKISGQLIADGKVDGENFSANGGVLKVGGATAESAKVYANGKGDIEISLDYTAKQADANAYSAIKGYYTTNGNASVIFKSENALVYDAEPGMTQVSASYNLYKDGTLQVKIGNDYNYGTINNGKVAITIGGTEYTYAPAVEAPASVYANIRGYYESADSNLVVYADGTFTKDLKDNGNYVISYDKVEEQFVIYSTLIAGVSEDSVLAYNNGYEFAIAGVEYAKGSKALASEEDYAKIAKTFTADIAWIDMGDAGKYLSTTKFLQDAKMVLDANGGIVWSGEEFFHTSTSAKWLGNTMLLSSTKDGGYVLFNDGSMKVYLPQVSQYNGTNKVLDECVFDANYNAETGALSLDVAKNWYSGLHTSYEFTALVDGEVAVDMDALYQTFAGAVGSNYTYVEKSSVWFTGDTIDNYFKFYNGTTKEQTENHGNAQEGYKRFYMYNNGWSRQGDYRLVPITETYGTVEFKFDEAGNTVTCYYTIVNGKARMRICLSGGGAPTNHFVDMYRAYGADSFDSKTYFNLLAGTGGTVDTPVSKTYTGSGAELVLYNDGVLIYTMTNGQKIPTAGKAKFNGQDVTYNLVATSDTAGLFFLDMDANPKNTGFNASRHVIGEYYQENGKNVIKFSFQGKDYLLSEDGFKELALAQLVIGEYENGTANTLSITADELTLNGTAYEYQVQMSSEYTGKLVLANSNIVVSYAITGDQIKIVANGIAFIKAYDYIQDLYNQYAGTYYGTYSVNYQSFENGGPVKNGVMPMTLTLNADGTFSGYGVKLEEGVTMAEAPKAYYDKMKTDARGSYLLPVKHLGHTDKTGTYTFKIIDGEVKIVLNFKGTTSTATDNSTYQDKKIVEFTSGYYNQAWYLQGTGNGISGYSSKMPSGWSGVTAFKSYNYASGTANGDTLSVLFEAFTATPITLTKVVAE